VTAIPQVDLEESAHFDLQNGHFLQDQLRLALGDDRLSALILRKLGILERQRAQFPQDQLRLAVVDGWEAIQIINVVVAAAGGRAG
jgi:hypothetical protein